MTAAKLYCGALSWLHIEERASSSRLPISLLTSSTCCRPAQERPIDCASQYESEEYIVFVKDTSSNGTFVNGKRIGNQNKIAIKHGDVVAVTQKRGSGLLLPSRRAYDTSAKSPFACSTAAAWCYYPRTWSLRLHKAMNFAPADSRALALTPALPASHLLLTPASHLQLLMWPTHHLPLCFCPRTYIGAAPSYVFHDCFVAIQDPTENNPLSEKYNILSKLGR